MTHADIESYASSLGQAMVELADAKLDQVCKYSKGDKRLTRLNLIAFCTFGITWAAADKINKQTIDIFTSRVLHSAASKSGFPVPGKLVELFRNRQMGFLSAVVNLEHNQNALPNYFLACCSVDRIEIDYEDIYPDPADLEEMDKMFGLLTDEGREMIRKVRSMHKPAVYPLDTSASLPLVNLLMGIMEHAKQVFAKTQL